MSSPTPDNSSAPKPARGSVVSYTREDPITDRTEDGLGVVLGVDGDQVAVRPLTNDTVFIPVGDVQRVAAGDVG